MPNAFTNRLAAPLAAIGLAVSAAVLAAVPAAAPALAETREMVMAAPRDLAPGPEDAYYTSTILHVWEPLVVGGEDGRPVPHLVTDWRMSEDGKTWTFTIRQNVTFHNGETMTAEHVVANFRRMIDVSPKRSPFYTMNVERSYPGLVSVDAVDDARFTMVFDAPRPTLPYAMVNFSSPVVHPDSFDDEGNFSRFPIGTGPFRLVAHDPQVDLVIERFDGYWGAPAGTQRIRVRTIPDADTRAAAFRAEEIVAVMDLGAMPPEQAVGLAEDPRFEISYNPSSISHYLHINGTDGPLADARMRQAISLAIDRDQIVELYRGFTTPTVNFLNVTNPFHIDIPIEHDVGRAAELADAVLGGGRASVRMLVPSWGLGRYPYRAQSELIQFMLAPIGLDVAIEVMDGGAFNEAMRRGEYDIAMRIQGLPNADPATLFNSYLRAGGNQNMAFSLGYDNPQMNALIDAANASLDLVERAELYAQIQRLAARDLPTVPLMNDATVIVHHVDVVGLEQQVYGTTLPRAAWSDD